MRQNSLALLTLVLGLLVGAGMGYLLGSGGTVEASGGNGGSPQILQPEAISNAPSPLSSTAPDLGEVGALPELALGKQVGGDQDGLSSAELARAEQAASSALGRVSAASDDGESERTGVITGTVVDEMGTPIAGATVVSDGPRSRNSSKVTARSTESVGRAFPGVKALEEELDSYAKSRVKRRKNVRTAVADAAGAFSLEGLAEGSHPLRGYLEGYVLASTNAETGGVVQLIAKRVGAFELDVRLPDGSQPDEAIVMALDDKKREKAAGKWTKEEPSLRFPTTMVRCRVLAGDPQKVNWSEVVAEYSSSMMTLNLDTDGPGPHVVELAIETQLRVTVVDESSTVPRLDPWVSVRSLDSDGSKVTPLKRYGTGPFILSSLDPGSYEVTAGRGKSAPEVTTAVEVSAGLNEEQVTLGDLDLDRFIVARCVGSDGAPMTSVEFRYSAVKKKGGSRSGGVDATSGSPGEYLIDQSEFRGQNEQQEELKSLQLTATSAVMGQITQEIDPSASALNFVFEEPGEVDVQVTGDLTGSFYVALVPVKVEDDDDSDAMDWMGRARARGSAKVGKDGVAQVGLVQPGDYDLELTAKDNEWGFDPAIASVQVTVASGDNRLSIAAPVLANLSVHAPDMEVGATFHLQSRKGDDSQVFHGTQETLNDQHRALFEGVAPGDYTLHAWGETQGQMEVTVPCGEVLFVADEVTAYEVTGITKGKLAEKAGLLKGDLIVAVNAHQVEGVAFMNRLWVEFADGPSTLQVLRGGREVQLELEKMEASANAWTAFGARLTPRAGRD